MMKEAFKENQNFDGLSLPTRSVQEILNSSLYSPIEDLFSRPSKNLRAQLVRAGFLFAQPQNARRSTLSLSVQQLRICSVLADALETIHAGSLIIDDIQDGSRERRGFPSMHEKYGTPLALNAGNYLYFPPFAWIESLGLSETVELKIYRLCHSAMLNAHLGQAIDLGASISNVKRENVEEICRNASLLKTGCLTSLALTLGAAAGGADSRHLNVLKSFGENFGLALQRFDDIGNLSLNSDNPKRFEDLRLQRPSWAWGLASRLGSDAHYRSFRASVEDLPNETRLNLWFERERFFEFAQKQNVAFLNDALDSFRAKMPSQTEAFSLLESLAEKLRSSYGPK